MDVDAMRKITYFLKSIKNIMIIASTIIIN